MQIFAKRECAGNIRASSQLANQNSAVQETKGGFVSCYNNNATDASWARDQVFKTNLKQDAAHVLARVGTSQRRKAETHIAISMLLICVLPPTIWFVEIAEVYKWKSANRMHTTDDSTADLTSSCYKSIVRLSIAIISLGNNSIWSFTVTIWHVKKHMLPVAQHLSWRIDPPMQCWKFNDVRFSCCLRENGHLLHSHAAAFPKVDLIGWA